MIDNEKRLGRIGSAFLAILILTVLLSSTIEDTGVESAPSVYEKSISNYSNIEYAVVLGAPSFEDEFDDLAQWRQMTGLDTEVFLIDEILTSDNGDDDAEKLFNFISQLHSISGGRLRYLLLAGDAELVPTRYLHAGASDYGLDDLYLSDVYYSSPGLDWDHDGDGLYGEREDIESIGVENISFPIRVGRAPVSNDTEAHRFVHRVISYETDPPEGTWTREGILSSSLMDTPNIIDNPLTQTDEGFNSYKDNGYKAILNYTRPYIPRSIDLIEAHDYMEYQGGMYTNGNDTLDAGTLASLLSNGSAFFTFAGQSYYDVEYPVSPFLAYSLAQWIAPGDVGMEIGFDTALTHSDTWNLTNGGKLPVVYISSCDSANFSDPGDRDLSNLLYAPDGGAICMVGSTGISWRGEGEDYSLGNWYLMPRFWEKIVRDHMPGEALYDLKQDYLGSKWEEIATKEPLLVGLYTYNYLGDPALSSWLGEPKDMVVDAISEDLFAGKDSFEVQVKDSLGTPLLEATVSIMLNGSIFKGITGPDGKVTVHTDLKEGGNAHLTVTAMNFIPYRGNVPVQEEPSNVIAVPGSIEISSKNPTEGSDITISARFRNMGEREIMDMEVSLFDRILDTMDEITGETPEAMEFVTLAVNATVTVSFEVTPLRSWSGVTIAAMPLPDELAVLDNLISMVVDINARPRFLPLPQMELMEDSGQGTLDLSDHVFEPDGDDLDFTILPGSPSWTTIEGSVLNVDPPSNFSGLFSIDLSVGDGIASDHTTLYIHVGASNDAPVLVLVQSRYEAVVDRTFSVRLETVDAEGDIVDVNLSTDLVNLKMMGNNLRFVPYEEDIGIHQVNITLSDPAGAFTNYTLFLEIVPSGDRLYFLEPSVHLPPASSGEEYRHKIEVGGDLALGAKFSDNSSLFDIDEETGEIIFTPSDDDLGEHWVKITVTNGNLTVERNFMFRIDEGYETPTIVYWLLGSGILIALIVIIALYMWSGREMVQYGLEE